MLHSPPLMSQTDHGRPSSSWEKNISIENSQAYLALPPHSFVISEFSSAMECFNNNNNMFGGANSSCAEPEFYESETKPKMISVDWDSPITAAEAVSPCAHGSSLSVGNSVDHKTTGIFIGKEDESLNSDSVKCKLTESHQTESAAPSYNQYASQGSEEESSWSTHPSRTHHGPLIMNTTSSQIKSSDTEIDGSRRTDAILNLREFPVEAAADRDQNWVRKRSPSRLKEDDQHPQKWTPIKKIARDVFLSTKNSTEETASIKRDPPEALNYGHMGSRNTLRVCVDCKTTKTPLWRSGPHGPKSLCNACGIRYRKARRALAACESAETSPGSLKCKPEIQERRLDKFIYRVTFYEEIKDTIEYCKHRWVLDPK